jgi:ribosomal protein S27AE
MELAVRLGVPAGGAVARWPRCPRCGFILAASPRGRDRVICHRCGAEYVLWYRP